METQIFTDPVKIGPGIWFSMHLSAVHATTDSKKKDFEVYVNMLCDNFKCAKCKPHFRKFIDTHPFKNYYHIRNAKGDDIGMFQWTWELHNQVNKFLNKPCPSLEDSYSYYSTSSAGVCTTCGNATPVPEFASSTPRSIPPIIDAYVLGQLQAIPFVAKK